MAVRSKCLLFLALAIPHENVLDISRSEGRRASFCNRHRTKDVISSIILGFTAIFTELRLDVLFHIVYEL